MLGFMGRPACPVQAVCMAFVETASREMAVAFAMRISQDSLVINAHQAATVLVVNTHVLVTKESAMKACKEMVHAVVKRVLLHQYARLVWQTDGAATVI